MREELLKLGVRDDRIKICDDEPAAVDYALKLGERGDLVLVFADKVARCWKQITKFKTDADAARAAASERNSSPAIDERSDDGGMVVDGQQLIRDARGVRLPRELEAED